MLQETGSNDIQSSLQSANGIALDANKKEKPWESIVFKGSLWIFLIRICNQLLSLLKVVVTARVLLPDDFGLFGIALMTIGILDAFSQTGFQTALVQRKKEVGTYLDTAWTFNVLRGLLLFALVAGTAPYVSIFFGKPGATPLIICAGLTLLIQGFQNVGTMYFQKEMRFRRQFVYESAGNVLDFIGAIVLVLIFRNVWALVISTLVGSAARLTIGYLMHPFRPRFRFAFDKALELFHFGKWVLGSSVLLYLISQGDNMVVGKLLGATALGYYLFAFRFGSLPVSEITYAISQVAFPAYASLQDDIPRLRQLFSRTLQLTSILSLPLAASILVLAPEITLHILGAKWLPIVQPLRFLVAAGALRSVAAVSGQLFVAMGKPRIDTELQVVRLFVFAISVVPLTLWLGIVGTSIAVLLNILVAGGGFAYKSCALLKFRMREYVGSLAVPVGVAAMVVVLLAILKQLARVLGARDSITTLSVYGLIALVAWFGIAYFADLQGRYGWNKVILESFFKTRISRAG
jgi:lipopolysaccharide exporter